MRYDAELGTINLVYNAQTGSVCNYRHYDRIMENIKTLKGDW
jgi:hypothetical protein